MGISEAKKKIVIDNYFEKECDVNTSIKEAFTKGFELGLKKAPTTPQPKMGHWIENAPEYQNIDPPYICSECGNMCYRKTNYCYRCGCGMVEQQAEYENVEVKPIGYVDCCNVMIKMWIDNVLTDGEYNRIMDKLNAKEKEERNDVIR